MDIYVLTLAIIGLVGLAASWLPALTCYMRISYSIIFMAIGVALYIFTSGLPTPCPIRNELLTLRLSELVVIIALMGTGLKIDRVFNLRRWNVPFRLLTITMILCIISLTAPKVMKLLKLK